MQILPTQKCKTIKDTRNTIQSKQCNADLPGVGSGGLRPCRTGNGDFIRRFEISGDVGMCRAGALEMAASLLGDEGEVSCADTPDPAMCTSLGAGAPEVDLDITGVCFFEDVCTVDAALCGIRPL